MNKRNFRKLQNEKGMSTLVVVLLLLFVATLVTMYTANSMVREQQVSANQYRSDKALSAANAGLDYALAYYAVNKGPPYSLSNAGVKEIDNGALTPRITDASGTVLKDMDGGDLVKVTFTDVNGGNDPLARPYTITAIGTTEDSSAQRTISVEVDVFGAIPAAGLPGFPLIAKGTAGSWGNFTIINRYSNATIWTGTDATAIGSSETYLADPLDPPVTHADYVGFAGNPDPDSVLHASYSKAGLNSDIIEGDPNLVNLSDDDFFRSFMVEDKPTIKAFAKSNDQVFDGATVDWNDLEVSDGVKGLVWIEGDFKTSGALETIGSEEFPITLIINGDFETGGSGKNSEVTLVGMIYVIGEWSSGGNFVVQGGAIVEGNVANNGTPTIVYDNDLFDGSLGVPPGSIAAIRNGTWKDW